MIKEKRINILIFILLICGSSVFPDEVKPFAGLTALVEKKGGWVSDRMENARELYRERRRLGERFRGEVIRFVNNDIDRHYNIGLFLSNKYYLGDEKPMNELALLIFHQGLSLIEKSTREMDKADELSFRVFAVLLSHKMNFMALAIHHKTIAEKLYRSKKYPGTFPAIDREEHEIFKMIPVDDSYKIIW